MDRVYWAGSEPLIASCKMATQRCACGYFGDPKRECRCSPKQVENYRNRISGPLLDRIDIHVEAPGVEYKELSSDEQAESSEAIRQRVLAARKFQQERFAGRSKCRASAEMTHGLLKTYCKLDPEGRELLHRDGRAPSKRQSL